SMGIAHFHYRVQSRCCALETSRSVPTAAHGKTAFDFKLINAKSGCASGGHSSLGCLLHVRLADESCNAQEKITCLFASLMRGYRRTARAMAVVTGLLYLPFAASLRYRRHSRSWASHAIGKRCRPDRGGRPHVPNATARLH